MAVTKQHRSDLALYGGEPAFTTALPVGRPNMGSREQLRALLEQVLDSRWLTNDGPLVHEFERRLAALLGVRHCIATCNGTIGLEIAIRAAGLQGEVIVPSFTFIATAHALQWQGITPVFCDIDAATHNLDPGRVEELITPRTSGVLGVHLWGQPCAPRELREICQRHGLPLLYDAAHALGGTWGGRHLGGIGDAEVFSFHATKFVHSGEGGLIATNDDALARRARLMTNFGFVDYDCAQYLGTNGKMHELTAAIGLTSLDSMQDFVAINHKNYEDYRARLQGIEGLRVLPYDETYTPNYQYVVLEVEASGGWTRDWLRDVLWAENILARRYFYPGCHAMEPYATLYPEAARRLPVTRTVASRVLTLPTGTSIGAAEIEKICALIHCARRLAP